MSARHYRGLAGPRRVIAVTAGTALEELLVASGGYELVEDVVDEAAAGGEQTPPAGEEPASSSPAGEAGPAPVDTLPPVPPAPAPTAAPVTATPVDADPAAAAILAAAYAIDTAEGINSYLDEHPYAAELVLEHERANKARKGILEGRHAAAPSA